MASERRAAAERETAPPACIETPRLMLRSWSSDDAPALARALEASRPELMRWTPWVLAESESIAALQRRLERFAHHFATGVEWRYAILRRDEDGPPVGECGLFPRVGPGALEIGYWLATNATQRGFATEAAAAVGDHAFHLRGIERLEIRCAPANDASIRVPQRLGYRARTEPAHESPANGRPGGDVIIWERLRDDVREA
jgi:RimJ/RimL family protein N-acetyltransferase